MLQLQIKIVRRSFQLAFESMQFLALLCCILGANTLRSKENIYENTKEQELSKQGRSHQVAPSNGPV
jgi:hypothetical protein